MNGLLVLDKPSGVTSHDVVSIVRRATGEKSIGHLGTLDPMATGVLPLLLGKYTRLAQFFGQAEKHYEGHIRFGFATETFDAEGVAVAEPQPLAQSLEELREIGRRSFMVRWTSCRRSISAKKINGVPAHKLARAGAGCSCEDRPELRFTALNFARWKAIPRRSPWRSLQEDTCGRLRMSWGSWQAAGRICRACGVRAREPSRWQQAITVDQLEAGYALLNLKRLLPHPRTLLPEMPSVTVDDQLAGRLRNGMQVNLPEFSQAPLIKVFTASDGAAGDRSTDCRDADAADRGDGLDPSAGCFFEQRSE